MTPFILGRRGGSNWFLRILGIRPRKRIDKSKIIEALIVKIDSALNQIRDNIIRLKLRYKGLIERAIKTLLSGGRVKALIYLNEATEVKKIVKKLGVSEKALEQVKLRLETLESVTDVPQVLGEISGVLLATRDYIKDVMPNIALSLDSLVSEAKRVISETTDVGIGEEEGVYITEDAKKLLKEIENAVEESVSKQLPEIPMSLVTPLLSRGVEVKIKDAGKESQVKRPKRPIRKLSPEEIDRKVMEYILTHGGFIDVSEVASQLNVDKSEVMASLHRLKEQNKIIF
ncbi:MAG: hypothetical protein B6U85_06705 [Desulfurococcales archaeon ex4484_42]|nr:MAG: hypothetical protein B6U85_06705 [Desulfurococcales archaeon ex4484_42]